MSVEELARDMRLAALEGYKIVTKTDLDLLSNQLRDLYFQAGRWSGGARDYKAREAYHAYVKIEQRRK